MNAETPCHPSSTEFDPDNPSGSRVGKAPRLGLILLGVAVLAGAGIVTGYLPRAKARAATAIESKELAILTVTVIKPVPAKATAPLTLSGELKPQAEAAIHARANGYVKSWSADIGDTVKEGQILAELETPEIDHELAEARAELNQANAAQALAKTTSARYANLRAGHGVSEQEIEEKLADVKLKDAAVEAANAKVERLENLTSFGKIKAPFEGTITARKIDVGQLVSSGSGLELFHITRTTKLRVFVRVPQSYAASTTAGQTASLLLSEKPGAKIEAKIVRTAGSIDPASRTLLTELEVDNKDGQLLSGSYAQVLLTGARSDAAITVPSNALLFRAEGPQVGIVHNDGKVELRSVQPGRDFGPITEILTGVTPEDKIILNPADSLVTGLTVRIAPQKEEAPAA